MRGVFFLRWAGKDPSFLLPQIGALVYNSASRLNPYGIDHLHLLGGKVFHNELLPEGLGPAFLLELSHNNKRSFRGCFSNKLMKQIPDVAEELSGIIAFSGITLLPGTERLETIYCGNLSRLFPPRKT